MITTDELRILLKINGAATYTKTINEVSNVTNNYNRSVGNLMATLAKLVSAGMVMKFAKQCVESASRLQEVANVVDVTFGQNADIVNKWAKEQAAGFGLSETAAKQYIGTYGTMAKQFNMTTDQATKMGVELTKLTGDVASFYNISDSAAATKLKSVFTGETESLKELGVVMTETQLNAFAMSKGFGKTVKDMTEQEKVLLRYQFTLEKLNHAQGDFARTSDGFANSSRVLQLNLENLRIEIGKELLPVAVQCIQTINSGLQIIGPPLQNAARYVRYYAEAWKNASATTKAFVGFSLGAFAVMAAIPKAIKLINTAIDIMTIKTLTFKTVLQGVIGLVGLLFAAAAIRQLSAEVDAIKAREAAEKIDALSESSDTAAGTVDELSNALDTLGDSTKGLDTFLTSFDEVNKAGGNNSLMSGIVNENDLANILAAAAGLDDLSSITEGIEADFNDLGGLDFFSATWWKQKIQSIINELKLVGIAGLALFSPVVQAITTAVLDSIASITSLIAAIKQKITDFFNSIIDKYNEVKAIISTGAGLGTAAVKAKTGGLRESTTGTAATGFATAAKALFGLTRFSGGGLPNKGSLFIAGETGAELVGNFGGSQTKVLNQSQMGGTNNPAPIYFKPIIMLNGRQITAAVVDESNNWTRSGDGSPIITLGG